MQKVYVTTSWDDGHKLDIRLAALLHKYNLPATFYVSPNDREFAHSDLLSNEEVKQLSNDFEIGAHTMTHPRLTKISDAEAYDEIADSKKYLEAIIGKKILSFCYPGGNYKSRHARLTANAGFVYARTVQRHINDLRNSIFESGTSVNAYNHYQDLWKIARFAHFNPLKTYYYFKWENLAKAMFDHVQTTGGVFHLWGHSWEIDAHGDWDKLENVFRYISHKKDCTYVTNGELATLQPKRLLMAAPYFPPHLGGVEYYAYNLAIKLQHDFGWYVCVVTTGARGVKVIKSVEDNLIVYRLPYWLKISNTPLNPLWPFWIRRIVKHENISIINAHAPVPLFADMALRVASKVPVVISYHMMSMAKGRSGADRLIALYEDHVLPTTLNRAQQIICSSDKVRDIFLSQFSHKSVTITPGVDTEKFHPTDAGHEDKLLFVGSLNKSDNHKGLIFLLGALKIVKQTHPHVHLDIVGEGSGVSMFEKIAEQYDVSGAVRFLGGQYDENLAALYRKSNIFILPTLNDSFPLVILEAMASGVPVISTNVGGIPTMIDDQETGYLIQPGDSNVLAEKIQYLLDNPKIAKEFGKNGRNKVAKNLTWNNQAEKTNSVLIESLRSAGEQTV
jgi:glycosyltransferase involved in cell wall biosynthesis/peptidoglycan/xylan/chitin deacetylase (PgdA/CDA1 family)